MHFLPAITSVLALSFSSFTTASPIVSDTSVVTRQDAPVPGVEVVTAALTTVLTTIYNVEGLLYSVAQADDVAQIEVLFTLAAKSIKGDLQPIKDLVEKAADVVGLGDVVNAVSTALDGIIAALEAFLADPSIESAETAVDDILGNIGELVTGALSQLAALVGANIRDLILIVVGLAEAPAAPAVPM